MACWQWWLMLAICALSAVEISASERTADNAGVCIRIKQYVVNNGKRATDGMTTTYCAGERDCRRLVERACCTGWRRDPNWKKLRCVKIDANDRTSTGTLGFGADLGDAEDFPSMRRVRNTPKKEVGAREQVRLARHSPPESGSAPAESPAVDQSGVTTSPNGGPDKPNGTLQTSDLPVSAQVPSQKGLVSGPHTDIQKNTNTTGAPIPSSTATVADGSGKVTVNVDSQPAQSPVPPTPNTLKVSTAVASGKTEDAATQSSLAKSQVTAGPASTNPSHSLPNGKQPGEPQSSSSSDASGTHTTPNIGTTTPPVDIRNKDTTHGSAPQDSPPPRNTTGGTGASREPSEDGSAPTSSAAIPLSALNQPAEISVEPKDKASSHSETNDTGVKTQTLAEEDQSNKQGKTDPARGPEDRVVASGAAPTVSTSVEPHAAPTTNQPVATATPKVQPQGSQSTTSAASGHNSMTTASPVVTNSSRSSELATLPQQTTVKADSNIAVVSTPAPSNHNTSSSQDPGSLTLTSHDLEHGQHVETIPLMNSSQSSSEPTVPTTTSNTKATGTTTITTATIAPITAANNTNTTHILVTPHPEVVGTTHPAQTTRSNNSVHTSPFVPFGNATTATTITTAQTQSISHSGTTTSSVPKPTSVPVPQHPNVHTGNDTHKYNTTSSVITGLHGNTSTANATGKNANGTSLANCTAAAHTGNCSGNCSHVEDQKNCTDSNDTIPLLASTALPVAKPLGDKSHASSTAVPSGSSASKTASEVTISLLLVAAVAFVAGLLYWRSRRRRRRYINCGTREPNLNFSNPVYDLEAMMEQTSLVKLQNAADIEDGETDNSEPEATFQRK